MKYLVWLMLVLLAPIRLTVCLWCGQWFPLIGGPSSRKPWHCKNCGRD